LTGLGEAVRAFADRTDVAAVVLLSGDGLPIQAAGRRPLDAESAAALAATLTRHAGAFLEATGLGALETAVLETAGGLAVVSRVGTDWLVVLPTDAADAGLLLYDLRCHRGALLPLL
jgi:predicted regulator of Ras-like GTPase activity (Roadblock/LC7/MglB family)